MQGALTYHENGVAKEPIGVRALVIGKSTERCPSAEPLPETCATLVVKRVADFDEALRALAQSDVDLVLIDADEAPEEFATMVRHVVATRGDLACAVITSVGDEEMWLNALAAGACDLIEKHCLPSALEQLVRRLRPRAAA